MFCREFPFVLDFSGSFVNGIMSYEYFWAFWKVFRCWTHYLIIVWTGATCMWNKGSREGFCCPLCHWWPRFFREQKQTSCNEQMCVYLCQTTSSQFINRAESQTWSWDVTSAFAAHARQTSQNILRGFIVAEDQKLLFEMFMTAGRVVALKISLKSSSVRAARLTEYTHEATCAPPTQGSALMVI